MVKKYRKKPVLIEAMQFNGSNQAEIFEWANQDCDPPVMPGINNFLIIDTLEGPMTASPGDYIIKGIKGEFYPCNPDIFEATYEEVVG